MYELPAGIEIPELTTTVNARNLLLAEYGVRAYQRDRDAFAWLYEYYQKPLGKYLMLLVSDRETARDLYQETFVRLWQHISNVNNIPYIDMHERFRRLLYRIARNLAIDYLRHTRKIEFLPLPEETSQKFKLLSMEGHEEQVCEQIPIEEALAAMSPQYRICWLLQVQWKYTQREIAEALGISEKAVSTNVMRAYKQLRKIYKNIMDDNPPTNKKGGKRNG